MGRVQEVILTLGIATTKATQTGGGGMCRNQVARRGTRGVGNGAGNGIRTRDFDLGKVALYH